MKSSYAVVVVLLLAASTISNAEDLLDAYGNAVQPGQEYYMLSAISNVSSGGVLPISFPGESSCPMYVGQPDSNGYYGAPVVFSSVNRQNATSIQLQEMVHIRFSKVEGCVKTPYWTLRVTDDWRLATGGSEPTEVPPPASSLTDNIFSFRKRSNNGNAYQLFYCACNRCDTSLPCLAVVRVTLRGRRTFTGTFDGFQPGFHVIFLKSEDAVSTDHFPPQLRSRASSN